MMDFTANVERLRTGGSAKFPDDANSLAFAQSLDAQDPIRHLRDQFIFPTKGSLRRKALPSRNPVAENGVNGTKEINGDGPSLLEPNGNSANEEEDTTTSIYFCGNSLGLQPKAVREYLNAQLDTWASIGVGGHFISLENSPLPMWQDLAEQCAKQSAQIVGASPEEIVVMNTLTVNIHLLMASFYRPTEKRHKIILEWKPFPSDYYAIESHIKWHGLDATKSMVEIAPDENFYISTSQILATIDAHADSAALLLLPGLQYYSGQLFDIPAITAHAQSRGLLVAWDLAHAAGNVPLHLHDWNVDFAMWCTYKYLNAGPGATAGAFVHSRYGGVTALEDGSGHDFWPRLAGWYGGDKSVRFNMAKTFQPTPGAAGYQLSNPSAIDLASLSAALSVFEKTSMEDLRSKSLVLTAYAEHLLDLVVKDEGAEKPAFRIITPRNPEERGAQLCVFIKPELLEQVTGALKGAGVVCDQRKPDVIRVSPVPMYNTFEDVWRCVDVIRKALGVHGC